MLPSFRLCWMAKKYDDWFLDPLVGFIIPGVGDIISSAATFPAVYVALFKIRSLKLTMAILATMVLDLLCGLVPGIGDLCDAFYKSSKIAPQPRPAPWSRDAGRGWPEWCLPHGGGLLR